MIRVMIVEDDPMVAEFNKRYLEEVRGFELKAMVPSVEKAIGVLEQQDIDLILLDIFMPGKLGLDLLTYLRKHEKATDVIVISAASDMDRIQKALRYGAFDYLIKPFEFERLQIALTAYQEKTHLIRNQKVISQKELDHQILYREEKAIMDVLPKGLTKDTLKQVFDAIQEMKDIPFSTDDMVKAVGISRVSIRKYLNFLKEVGILDVKVIYGAIGRPVYQHEFNKRKEHIIKNFL
jgi:two-component system, CitB family, response regulator MalR